MREGHITIRNKSGDVIALVKPITPVYRSWNFSREKIPGLRWESNPQPPQLRCDALPVELLSPWEQGGGERGS